MKKIAYESLRSRWLSITLFWLITTSILGIILRIYPYFPVPGIDYGNLLHGHSHVAFLGWIFNALFVFITDGWLLNHENQRFYNRLFLGLQASVTGMFIFFPIYGYNALTIVLSSIHTVLAIIFAIRFFRQARISPAALSTLAVTIALVLMLISSAGPFMLAPLAAADMKHTIWYNLAIYFYLHFQYNGWFLFGVCGLLLRLLEKNQIPFRQTDAKAFLWINAIAVIPSYALSALWTNPPLWVFIMALTGTGLQVFSLLYLLSLLRPAFPSLRLLKLPPMVSHLLLLVLMSFVFRNAVQFTGSLPGLSTLSSLRPVAIAYLHLNFLGIATPALIAYFLADTGIRTDRILKGAFFLFLAGFILSEFLLFISPLIIIPYTAHWQLALSVFVGGGLALWSLLAINKIRRM